MLDVAIDGTDVSIRASETLDRHGKHPGGRARTREVKLAALFTQTKSSPDGYPIRDPDSTSYLATFDNSETFGRLVTAAALERGHDHHRQTVILGDGARWIWTGPSPGGPNSMPAGSKRSPSKPATTTATRPADRRTSQPSRSTRGATGITTLRCQRASAA